MDKKPTSMWDCPLERGPRETSASNESEGACAADPQATRASGRNGANADAARVERLRPAYVAQPVTALGPDAHPRAERARVPRADARANEQGPSTTPGERGGACPCRRCRACPGHPEAAYHRDLRALLPRLAEPQRRWLAALEARRLGFGGTRQVASITGLDEKTVRRGRREMAAAFADVPPRRQRRRPAAAGGGRPRRAPPTP
jgi:hypothetical protein